MKGLMAVRRTEKPFSASYQDLVLEQTINLDAANKKHGKANVSYYIATLNIFYYISMVYRRNQSY
jgi:hypothetical protein